MKAMRKFYEDYDIIFVDIDDTLIYGFWVTLMRITWDRFKSPVLSSILSLLQVKYKLFNVNRKLVMALGAKDVGYYNVEIVTARGKNDFISSLLENIFEVYFENRIVALGSNHPAEDKLKYMVTRINEIQNKLPEHEDMIRACIIDDNEGVRNKAMKYGIDAFDPTVMFEKGIG